MSKDEDDPMPDLKDALPIRDTPEFHALPELEKMRAVARHCDNIAIREFSTAKLLAMTAKQDRYKREVASSTEEGDELRERIRDCENHGAKFVELKLKIAKTLVDLIPPKHDLPSEMDAGTRRFAQ